MMIITDGMASATLGQAGLPSLRAEIVGAQTDTRDLITQLQKLAHAATRTKAIGDHIMQSTKGAARPSADAEVMPTVAPSPVANLSMDISGMGMGSWLSGFGLGELRGGAGSSSGGAASSALGVKELAVKPAQPARVAASGKGKKAKTDIKVDYEVANNMFSCRCLHTYPFFLCTGAYIRTLRAQVPTYIPFVHRCQMHTVEPCTIGASVNLQCYWRCLPASESGTTKTRAGQHMSSTRTLPRKVDNLRQALQEALNQNSVDFKKGPEQEPMKHISGLAALGTLVHHTVRSFLLLAVVPARPTCLSSSVMLIIEHHAYHSFECAYQHMMCLSFFMVFMLISTVLHLCADQRVPVLIMSSLADQHRMCLSFRMGIVLISMALHLCADRREPLLISPFTC